jgi:hypothetical protein
MYRGKKIKWEEICASATSEWQAYRMIYWLRGYGWVQSRVPDEFRRNSSGVVMTRNYSKNNSEPEEEARYPQMGDTFFYIKEEGK